MVGLEGLSEAHLDLFSALMKESWESYAHCHAYCDGRKLGSKPKKNKGLLFNSFKSWGFAGK